MPEQIRRVAVLGAGTMGAAIAAHAANAGLEVDLLDLPAPSGSQRAADDVGPNSKVTSTGPNGIVRAGFERMRTARPAALMSAGVAERIRLGNFQDDFDRVGAADWVIEAVLEKLEPKRELMERVEKVAKPDAVISSNTSGIPLSSIAQGRSEDFRRRWLGTHFFNPPRYLKLVELIVTPDTDPAAVTRVREVIEGDLGKGVVFAKDTPNFIANRLGVMDGMACVAAALEGGFTVEEVDALTGELIGRPKTATFRLFDQVGLDVMLGVAGNLHELAPDDDRRETLVAPGPLRRMADAGLLGLKTGAGFYKRAKRDGQTVFDVIDFASLADGKEPAYRPPAEPDLPIADAAGDIGDLGARLRSIVFEKAPDDSGAKFLRDLLLVSLAYASRRVPEIAESLVDVDHAIEWGFGHRHGPFRTWDLLGVSATVELMDQLGIPVGDWVRKMLDGGSGTFYIERGGAELAYTPRSGNYERVPQDPEVLDLERVRSEADRKHVVAGNGSASLVDLGDDVLCLELHAPASAVDAGVLEMGRECLRELDGDRWRALVIASRKRNFCVGANIGEIGMAAYQIAASGADTAPLDEVVRSLQDLLQGLRFGAKPVVAAPHGQTLGAGAEICMAADRVVASAETYMGLVEFGVGVIPAGGGCKELLRRVVSKAVTSGEDVPPLPHLQRVFETIALAKVATSALEARELGFLTDADRVVMHPDRLLSAAKREALALADGYRPPPRDAKVYAAGAGVLAALELGVRTLRWAGQASEYDEVIAGKLAGVLCGGELSAPQWVREQYVLDLERAAFVDLIVRQPTLERIQAMLTTGKPLRN
jgi:3-hydroxyacyl-CoA dehydrogenase